MENNIAIRIKSARIMSGLTLETVAAELGISKQAVNRYEKGEVVPDSAKLISMAKLFSVNIDFFFRNFSVQIEALNFRKKTAFSNKKQKALKEEIKLRLENYLLLEGLLGIDYAFENVLAQSPIQHTSDAVKAAGLLREKWNIGSDPLHNIIQLLEDKEIKVIELDADDKFDGLATFADGKYPVIVVNANFSLERKRFTLLHELGHILMNLPQEKESDIEKHCNSFAAELLMPMEILEDEFGKKRKDINFVELAYIQTKYGISIRAILYRLGEAGILSKERLTQYYKQINYNAKLKSFINESRFATPEKSDRFERLVYRAMSQEIITASKAAALLHTDLNNILDKNSSFA